MTAKILATSITIIRAEGPSQFCLKPTTFAGPDCWSKAHAWLISQSHTFPATGSYHKHSFVIMFADGEGYEGRLDCRYFTCEGADLDVAEHVRGHMAFTAGLKRPSRWTEEQYERYLAEIEEFNPGSRENAKQWLDTYQVG